MADTLRQLLADVLAEHSIKTRPWTDRDEKLQDADALLASPALAAIVTLAAFAIVEEWPPPPFPKFEELPTDGPLRVMLREWRGDD